MTGMNGVDIQNWLFSVVLGIAGGAGAMLVALAIAETRWWVRGWLWPRRVRRWWEARRDRAELRAMLRRAKSTNARRTRSSAGTPENRVKR